MILDDIAAEHRKTARVFRRGNAATPGKEAVVLGGGMAGLTAAHELVERGFTVTVFEPTAWGGKARSIPFAGTGTSWLACGTW
mgnify:CR=1 FL=1